MLKETLLNKVSVKQVLAMFDMLPDIIFWIKDIESRVVYANQMFVEHIGYSNLEQVLGKSDSDLSPVHVAKQFIADDQKVMLGELVTDRLEMNINEGGELAWFSTSKRPLFDEYGVIIGSYGVTRHLKKTVKTLSGIDELKVPVQYIRDNFHMELSIEKLAQVAYLSVSALERRFKKYLAKTPKQFIRQVRLDNARRLLVETKLPIAQIAYQSGFSDHSYFSRHFKLMFDELPSELRQQRLSSSASSAVVI
ncbi:helix-turn-helix domain-containing protein [Colwellia sp. 12G3]|uniref:helix-turn-helix domain-containing protein n=1 Tax=Colwellia sp. 12G3 TaxID=2058299 RepID=UPI000C33716E|nr:helix-turn-helix domain-containing protein [Colwellia sp. 12G3]PKI17056.1 AraC family transcriptional regulator [Colwellia sp. 12G3]